MFLWCVWEMSWRRGQTAILTKVLLTKAALLSHLGWGCSTVGHWGPKALCLPLALTSASCPQQTQTAPGTWLYYCLNVHLLPLFFHFFTQVHLLIDGSVEGQYITNASDMCWIGTVWYQVEAYFMENFYSFSVYFRRFSLCYFRFH